MNTIPEYEEVEIRVNDPRAKNLDLVDLKRAATTTLAHLGYEEAALTIIVTSDEEVAHLNQAYRQVNAPTDVLSFPASEGDEMFDLPPEIESEISGYLGDLIIAYPFTVAQAIRYRNPIENELRLLVVHGILHLLGYDHDTEERQHEMWQIQGEVLSALGDSSTNWERAYES